MTRLLFLFAGLALFVYLFVQLGPGAVLSMVGRIGWGAAAIALAYTIYQVLRAMALSACVRVGGPLRVRDALWIRLSGEAVQFLTFTGPFLAEPAKAWLLKGRGLTATEGFAATLTEYLSYMFISAALSIAAFWWILDRGLVTGAIRSAVMTLLIVMVSFLAAAAIAIASRTHLLGAVLEGISRLPGIRRRLRPDMPAVHRVEDLLLDIMHDRPGRFAGILLLESASHALHILELYVILRALEMATGIGVAALIEGATKFIGLLFFFVPGQVGASEGAHAVVFETLGFPAVAGFSIPFVRRIRAVTVAALGLVTLSLLTRAQRRPAP
jgi:hypothetical protein